ncbi:methyl-accepting chemotaxis protein [Cognatishimia sp. F0-27]|uniref:methyl-accepting chemotaxis protein n=1 Tax=Cognatishimia sp. F0-27 TaxID=2816855 RepID=UPI001D0BF5C1|nr:methyl-accepting chemotaxis protein [Cognatishimia sp. F0-27]MCC1491833.1 HAMP domain-containing protein [Cognatishimia sp. F0-27]
MSDTQDFDIDPSTAGDRGMSTRLHSMFLKVAGLMAVTTLVVAGAMAFQAISLVDGLAKQGVMEQTAKTADLKAQAALAPVRFGAVPKILEVIDDAEGAMGDGFRGGLVLSQSGEVYANEAIRADVSARLTELAGQVIEQGTPAYSEDGMSVAFPIKPSDESPAIGAFALSMSADDALAAVWAPKMTMVATGFVLFAAMSIVTMWVLRRMLGNPLKRLASAIETVSQGNYDAEIPMAVRKDELGGIARKLKELVVQLQTGRDAEEARARHAEAQSSVVDRLSDALTMLAEGCLSSRLDAPFPDEYETLRENYNRATDSLADAIANVNESAQSIRNGSDEIASASDDLSRRTETQAATLEQTAAALEAMLTGVRDAAKSAADADRVVRDARSMASRNGEVMQAAVSAMSDIEASSDQIGEIISVIDDIAFQTNLLALNAGVEAARAGESGKGFAVVAAEVRALAQRSSDAAQQIKDLISGSSEKISDGVRLVERAGSALEEVVSQVGEISNLVAGIAQGAEEQAQGLNEINVGVSNLDQVTQKNAAMVEEATAAVHMLKSDANTLAQLVTRFEFGAPQQATAAQADPSDWPASTEHDNQRVPKRA